VFLEAAKEYKLTNIQFAILLTVEQSPGIDQARLGRLVALDRQTTSNVVTRLAQYGLIERKSKNKRTHALQITGAARALIQVMRPRMAGIDDTILGPLSADEREVLMGLLKKLVTSNNELSRAPAVGSAGARE
jgi:DNA-binding MarR family transcriptional regulator